MQHPSLALNLSYTYGIKSNAAGLVVGGGATARSAAQALAVLGLSPIYLINRDVDELLAMRQAMPHLNERLIHLRHPQDVEAYLGQNCSPRVFMAVGAIRE